MKKLGRNLTIASAAIFAVSVVANLAIASPGGLAIFPLFFFVHIAVVILGAWAILRILKMRATWAEVFRAFKPFPAWLGALAIAVLVLAIAASTRVNMSLGSLPDGTQVHSKSWNTHGGKYWLSLNKQPFVEITESEYEKLQLDQYRFFALSWLPISYIVMVQWFFIWRTDSRLPRAV